MYQRNETIHKIFIFCRTSFKQLRQLGDIVYYLNFYNQPYNSAVLISVVHYLFPHNIILIININLNTSLLVKKVRARMVGLTNFSKAKHGLFGIPNDRNRLVLQLFKILLTQYIFQVYQMTNRNRLVLPIFEIFLNQYIFPRIPID